MFEWVSLKGLCVVPLTGVIGSWLEDGAVYGMGCEFCVLLLWSFVGWDGSLRNGSTAEICC